jgi:hypothetical protein
MDFETMYLQICGLAAEAGEYPSEFTANKECACLSRKIYAARQRLGRRLGTSAEDADLVLIADAYERICLLVSKRVYFLHP